MQVAGGSILQTVFPLSVTVYFGYKRDWLGLVFGIFWLGNNLINVSYYIKDAPYRRLPLLGGDAVIHDWQWLLVKYQAIEHAESIGLVVWLVGLSCLMLAIGLGLMYALTMSKEGKITTDL